MGAAERAYINVASIVRAAEKWSPEYAKAPKQHARVIKLEASWEWRLRGLFKSLAIMARDTNNIVNWLEYNYRLNVRADNIKAADDFKVETFIIDDGIDYAASEFIKLSFEIASELVINGVETGEIIYGMPSGLTSVSAIIKKLGLEHVAALVGKKVLDDGSIVDNPKAAYNITKTMRTDIAESVKQSLALGETTQEASERVYRVVNNRTRSELIAQTESVNAYQSGLRQYASSADMVGKEWQSSGADDICAVNDSLGPVPLDYDYSGHQNPTAHPRCKCGMRYITRQEWTSNGYGDNPMIDKTTNANT